MANKYDDADGVWRTIGGRRVFIRTGQSLSDAMIESGKFSRVKKNEELYKKIEEEPKLTEKQKDAAERLNKKAENGVRNDIKDFLSGREDYDGTQEEFINDLSQEWGVDKEVVEDIFNEENTQHPRLFKTDRASEIQAKQEAVNKSFEQNQKELQEYAKKLDIDKLDAKAMELYEKEDEKGFEKFSDAELKELAKLTQITEDNPGGRAYDDEVWNEMDNRGLSLDEPKPSKSNNDGKYAAAQHIGFGDYNKDGVPVYDNKIDYTGDFRNADLSTLSDDELQEALKVQTQKQQEAYAERIGDQRTRNGKMDKIFNTAKKQQYEGGVNAIDKELASRGLGNNASKTYQTTNELRDLKEKYRKAANDADIEWANLYDKQEFGNKEWNDKLDSIREKGNKAREDYKNTLKEYFKKADEKDLTWQDKVAKNDFERDDKLEHLNEIRNTDYHYKWHPDDWSEDYYGTYREYEAKNAKIKAESEKPTDLYEPISSYNSMIEKNHRLSGDKFDASGNTIEYGHNTFTGKDYTNDEFIEHLENANWHKERRMLLTAGLTNQEMTYIKNKTKLDSYGADLDPKRTQALIDEAKEKFRGTNATMNNKIREEAFAKYKKAHPKTKKTIQDFMG